MHAHSAQTELERILVARGYSLAELDVESGIELMLGFYRNQRADDCTVSACGADMLLYQWGINDWGDGEWFELDLTRQFIPGGESEDENIWQLSLTFKFVPTDPFRALASGKKWCPNPKPKGVDYFAGFILASEAFRQAKTGQPVKVELDFECAG